ETLWQRWPAFDAELDRLLASPERLVEALRAARPPGRLTPRRRRARHGPRGARAAAADAARRARPHGPLGTRARASDARTVQRGRPRVLHGHLRFGGRRRTDWRGR